MNDRNSGALISGVLLVAWGAFLVVGLWFFRSILAHILPGLADVSRESALCLILSGAGLWAGAGNSERGIRLQALFGGLLALFAVFAASRFIPFLFSGNSTFLAQPRQAGEFMAPLAALAFMASGVILAFGHRVRGKWPRLVLQVLILVVLVIALVSSAGHALNLFAGVDVFDFGFKRFSLSWPTALGLLVLGTGIVSVSSRTAWWCAYYADRPDRQVLTIGTLLILMVALISGFIGVSLFANHSVMLLKETLSSSLQANSRVMLGAVKEAVSEAGDIAGMSNLNKLLGNGNAKSDGAKIRAELKRIKAAVGDSELAAIRVLGNDGRELGALGKMTAGGKNRVQLPMSKRAWLFWQDGFRVEVRVPIQDGAKQLGELAVEFVLEGLNTHLDFTKGLGSSGEVVICAPRASLMECYPSRLAKDSYRVPTQLDEQPLPMSFALAGRQGVVITRDYRRQKVLASYTPIAELGVGMVQKIDTEELYLGMRHKLWLSMALFGMFALAGAAVLFFKVKPVVLRLSDTSLHLREAQRIAHIGSWDRNVETNRLLWSDEMYRLFGLAPHQIDPSYKAFLAAIHPEDRERVNRIIEDALLKNAPFQVDYRIRQPNGQIRDVIAQGQVELDAAGRPVRTHGTVQDITERKLSEKSLRESEERFRNIMENAPVGMALTLLDGRFYLVNQAFCRLLGYEKTELEKLSFEDITHPDDRPMDLDNAQRLRSGEIDCYQREKRYIHKNGQILWVQLTVSAIKDDLGAPLYSIGQVMDISERKRAEEALRASYQEFEDLYNHAPCGYHSLDADGLVVRINDTELAWLGYRREEVVGRMRFTDLLMPQSRQTFTEHFPSFKELGNIQGLEYELACKDGTVKYVLLSATAIRDADGDYLKSRSTLYDITERRQAELNLDHLNRLYSVLSKTNEMIVRVNDRSELFREICRIAIEAGGFRMAWIGLVDPATQRVVPVVHWGHEDGYLEEIRVLAVDDEERGRGPTGRAVRAGAAVVCADTAQDICMRPWREPALRRGYRSSAAFPIKENGSVIGAFTLYAVEAHFFTEDVIKLVEDLSADVSYAVDVIEVKKSKIHYEQQLVILNAELEQRVAARTRQLEAANKELEAFSYSVSHDLRAPLRSIDGFSQILMKNHADGLDETGRDYLRRISRAGQRMGELIDDLLQLSRVGRGELRKETVDLSKLACSVGREIKAADPERRVEWAIQEGVTVEADGRLMRTMLENLLRNAWKFSAAKADARIEFGAFEQGGEKVLFVRDNGAGFDMQYAHKLFGAFQRLHRAEEFEGTGIGLAIVQRIVNQHGGRIWAEGAVGQGATFYFTI